MRKLALSLVALYSANALFGASFERLNLSRQLVYLEPELGQNDADVRYWVRGTRRYIRLTSNSIQLEPGLGPFVEVRFASGTPVSLPVEPLEARVNRYRGTESSWQRSGGWKEASYRDAYPGIDISIRPESGAVLNSSTPSVRTRLKLEVKPGARLDLFALSGVSQRESSVNSTGEFTVSFPWYSFRFAAPSAWQEVAGRRISVGARFVMRASEAGGIEAATYDQALPLFIETSMLEFASPWNTSGSLRTDAAGNIFVGGTVGSAIECGITTGGPRIDCLDAWVAGFRPDGGLIFLTVLEGKVEDVVLDLAWRAPGELIVLGITASADFPVSTSAYQSQNAGPLGPRPRLSTVPVGDLFVVRISALTGALAYSTFFGSNTYGESGRLAVAGDRVHVLVNGAPRNLAAATGGWMPQPASGSSCRPDALVRFNPGLSAVEKATYVPTASYSAIEALADGSVTLVGSVQAGTEAVPIATAGAYQTATKGEYDAYIARLRADYSAPIYATFYGATGRYTSSTLLLRESGSVSIIGELSEPNTNRAFSFLARFSDDGKSLVLDQRLESQGRFAYAAASLPDGRILVGGSTSEAILDAPAETILTGNCAGPTNFYTAILTGFLANGSKWFQTLLPADPVQPGGMTVNASGLILLLHSGDLRITKLDLLAPAKPQLACVTGAASRRVGRGIAPGQIVTLVGSGMGPTTGVSAGLTSDTKFPLTLAGATVRINGVAAPLLYVQDKQINAIVPYEGLIPETDSQIEVQYAGVTSSTTAVTIYTQVELFTIDYSGGGQAVALNENGSLNSESNPAAAGSIVVLYGTGIGTTQPASSTGSLAPLSGPLALARPIGPVAAFMNSTLAEVQYAGAAPGLVNGAAQFNLRIPFGKSGPLNVDIRINGSLPGNFPVIWVR